MVAGDYDGLDARRAHTPEKPKDRAFGCGRLIVESPGEHGELVLTEIPQVQDVQSTLFQLVGDEQARLAREQL